MSVKKLSKLTQKTAAPANAIAPHPEEMRYRAEDALRTITRAEAHKKDRELMKHVKRAAREQAKACGVK